MGMQFYRKQTPGTPVVIQGNLAISFKSVDGIYGYYRTDNPVIQSEFNRFQQEQRYAIEDITEAQFNELYEQKKTLSQASKPSWREEWSRSNRNGAQDLYPVAAPGNVPVPATPTIAAPPPPASTGPTTVQEFNPAVGKRGPWRPPKLNK